MNYDIIGDIHGHSDKLEALLRDMGYRDTQGAWRHSDRQAVFVGDFIDRGPDQVRTCTIVRRMIDAGAALAVMGNHEFNAIAWHTRDPREPSRFLREDNEKNRQQHEAFLAEVEDRPIHDELIDWFLSLPLWLDLSALRIVHACWQASDIDRLTEHLHDGRYLSRELMPSAAIRPAGDRDDEPRPSVFRAVETLLKGIEIPLPNGCSFIDEGGHERTSARARWWDDDATTYRAAAIGPREDQRAMIPDAPLPHHARVTFDGAPVFFGHFWLRGTPRLVSTRSLCVDYSAGKGGPLTAYRFDGDPTLRAEQFVWSGSPLSTQP
ncbi:MAG: metallophosphoesterase [Acidobacteria bacterium]|nr:metallophosphoesterase [Acidobacteriota bacterium]